MRRRLLVHPGSPKCGSTFLQRVLLKNRDMLLARGIDYPLPADGHPGNGGGLARLTTAHFDALFRDAHTVILSHEDLLAAARSLGALPGKAAAAGVVIDILVFLRPFSEFVYGDYSQNMKQHGEAYFAQGEAYDGLSFEAFAIRRRRGLRMVRWLQAWQSLAEGRLSLAGHRRIAETVEATLGGPGLDWNLPKSDGNPSLRIADCEAIAEALVRGASEEAARQMVRHAHAQIGDADPGRSPSRTAWLEALFWPETAALAQVFGFDNRPWAACAASRLQNAEPATVRRQICA